MLLLLNDWLDALETEDTLDAEESLKEMLESLEGDEALDTLLGELWLDSLDWLDWLESDEIDELDLVEELELPELLELLLRLLGELDDGELAELAELTEDDWLDTLEEDIEDFEDIEDSDDLEELDELDSGMTIGIGHAEQSTQSSCINTLLTGSVDHSSKWAVTDSAPLTAASRLGEPIELVSSQHVMMPEDNWEASNFDGSSTLNESRCPEAQLTSAPNTHPDIPDRLTGELPLEASMQYRVTWYPVHPGKKLAR